LFDRWQALEPALRFGSTDQRFPPVRAALRWAG
jgi:hypothetical protein